MLRTHRGRVQLWTLESQSVCFNKGLRSREDPGLNPRIGTKGEAIFGLLLTVTKNTGYNVRTAREGLFPAASAQVVILLIWSMGCKTT